MRIFDVFLLMKQPEVILEKHVLGTHGTVQLGDARFIGAQTEVCPDTGENDRPSQRECTGRLLVPGKSMAALCACGRLRHLIGRASRLQRATFLDSTTVFAGAEASS